jgi:hypothetical protein
MRSTLLVVLASACVTPAVFPSGAGDTDADTTEDDGGNGGGGNGGGRDDTFDAGGGDDTGSASTGVPGSFVPTSVGYYAEIAVDGQGRLTTYKIDGTELPSLFEVVLTDGTDTCWLVYAVDDSAFTTAGDGGSGALARWLASTPALLAGLQVADGGYTGTAITRGRCGDLSTDWSRPDLFENARTLGVTTDPTYVGIGGAPSADALDLADAIGVPKRKAIGGKMKLPFAFDQSQQTMDVLGTWAKVTRGELDLDGNGDPVWQDAADAKLSGRPAAGYYSLSGVFVFTPPF